MANPRIHQPQAIAVGETIVLNDDGFGHLVRVLRLKDGAQVQVFNGQPETDNHFYNYQAKLTNVSKKKAELLITDKTKSEVESPLNIHLGQGISRGDRMDFTLQKSVELGVSTITPIFTERCGVKLTGERLAKKVDQWQKIVISACEQSGRCFVPQVKPAIDIEQWLAQETSALKLNLHPRAEHSIMSLPIENSRVRLLIGPEGGLSEEEIDLAGQYQFNDILLGPRVLRTETAALTAITALQCRFGDLG